MGLISRVSSRTYRKIYSVSPKKSIKPPFFYKKWRQKSTKTRSTKQLINYSLILKRPEKTLKAKTENVILRNLSSFRSCSKTTILKKINVSVAQLNYQTLLGQSSMFVS